MSDEQKEEIKLSGPGQYWPFCRCGDASIFAIFMMVLVICATLIILLLIFTFYTLPVLVG